MRHREELSSTIAQHNHIPNFGTQHSGSQYSAKEVSMSSWIKYEVALNTVVDQTRIQPGGCLIVREKATGVVPTYISGLLT